MAVTQKAADALRRLAGKDPLPHTAAIIVSAGNSTRMKSSISKQFMCVAGVPVLARTLLAFEACPAIHEIVVVARAEELEAVWQLGEEYGITKLAQVCAGGSTRAHSVRRGFRKISAACRFVAIHDGARCLITPEEIEKICRAAYRHRAATAAYPSTDTVKRVNRRGFIKETLDRKAIYLVQTPQVFHADLYRAAMAQIPADEDLTDDNQLMERIGYPVKPVDIGKNNIKITHPADIARAEWVVAAREAGK